MNLGDLFLGAIGSKGKLQLPWMPSHAAPALLPAVQLPRDEKPHDRGLEWWHFMGHFRALHPDDEYASGESDDDKPPRMSFVVSILKGKIQGMTKLASLVIVIDHVEQTHTVSTQLGALGATYFEPDDGSAFTFHFGPPGPSRPGPHDAWMVQGGMGTYRLTLGGSSQIAVDLSQLTPAVLVGAHPPDRGDGEEGDPDREPRHTTLRPLNTVRDGVMRYADRDEMGYYAFPAMSLDGILGVGSQEQQIIGRAWMEHQWGDFPLGDYQWKYLAIDIKLKGKPERQQLLVFRARKLPDGRPFVHAVWIAADGSYRILDNGEIDVRDTRNGSFQGYPLGTVLTYPKQGTPRITLRVDPLFEDQECRTDIPRSVFPTFWEGACKVSGTVDGATVSPASWAITELVGYV